jgi:hypothetical protein
MSPEEAVRAFFDCYTNGRPEDFDACVAPDYVDYGHELSLYRVTGGLLRSTRHALIGGLPATTGCR